MIMKHRILATYEVTYSNGFKQIKCVISEDDYINIMKPISNAIRIIEYDNNGRSNKQSIMLKQSLSEIFGSIDWITESSPMGISIKTGILSLPKHQGGDHKISWKRIK